MDRPLPRLTDPQCRMLRMLAMPSLRSGLRQSEIKNPGKIAMLRHLEEMGLTSRGSISLRSPRWSITNKGREVLPEAYR